MGLLRVLATWGNGDCGRLGFSRVGIAETVPRVLKALLDVEVRQVACGGAHTAALANDGTVFCWGLNDHGQLGTGPGQLQIPVPQEVLVPEPVVAVAAGYFHTLALAESGNLWAWGLNDHGQLGIGREAPNAPEPRLVKALQGEKIASIAAGAEHSLALTGHGEVFSWGSSQHGRLGHGRPARQGLLGMRPAAPEFVPRQIRALEALRVTQISAGQMTSGCITSDFRVLMWGSNRFWELGLPEAVGYDLPQEVPGLQGGVTQLACGGLHTLALRGSGEVLAWGANQNGVLGLGPGKQARQTSKVPTLVPGLSADSVAAGWKHSAALANGRLLTWGWGGSQGTAFSVQEVSSTGGQLGQGDENDYWSPARVEWLALDAEGEQVPQQAEQGGDLAWRVLQVSCGLNHTAAVLELSNEVAQAL